MIKTFLTTRCGCATLAQATLAIIDSNRIGQVNIPVVALRMGNTTHYINTYFPSRADLMIYLNSTFVEDHDLLGIFTDEGNYFTYSNPENFQSAEIMAIIEDIPLIFRVGNPGAQVNKPFIQVANGSVISHSSLIGCEVLLLFAPMTLTQPITGVGYIHDSEAGTITWPADNAPQDMFITVLIKRNA